MMQFNFTGLKNLYIDALDSYDKSVAFDIRIGRGRFLFLMFLAEDDDKDNLFIYMRNTAIMRKLKMYGSHKKGKFEVYVTDEVRERMIAELQLQEGNGTFDFERFLNEINNAIPQKISIAQKVKTLRDNRNIINNEGIDEVEKTVLIGPRRVSKGKPQDRTLRKLYIYTDESEAVITEFIKALKKANMTVAWTTEGNRFSAADINAWISAQQEK